MISGKLEANGISVGPRKGTTTLTKSKLVRKNFWLPTDEAEALRLKAFRERRTKADIIRDALRFVLYEAS